MHLAARRFAFVFRARLRRIRLRFRSRPALALLAAIAALPAAGQTLYWDNNGATPGSSNVRDTWWPTNDSRLWWSTSAAGDVTTQGWTSGATAVFSAGANATSYSLIDIGQGVNVAAIHVEEGSIELWGAVFGGYFHNLSAFDVAAGASAILDATLRETDGAISFTKTGAGALTIKAPNQTTGAFTVSGGTVNITGQSNLSSGTLTVNNGATLANSGILELSNRTVNVTGAGSTLSSVNYIEFGDVGDVTVNLTAGGAISSQSSVAYGVNAGVTGTGLVSGSGSHLVSGSQIHVGYHGIGSLTVESGGRVTPGTVLELATYGGSTGTFNLDAGGILAVGGADGIVKGAGTAHLNLGGGTLEVTGSSLSTSVPMTLVGGTASTIDTNGLDAVFVGGLSGSGGLVKSGEGTLHLAAANTYSGGTTLDAGTLQLGNLAGLGSASGDVTLNGGVLDLGGFSPAVGTVIFNGGAFTHGALDNASAFEVRTGALAGSLGGAATLTKTGSGAFTLSGANTYSGGTTIDAGTLQLGNLAGLGSASGDVTLNGGVLDLGGFSPAIGTAIFNGGTFTHGALDNASAFEVRTGALSASLGGAAALTKTGPGVFTLAADHTYAGGTTISAGTLVLGAGGSVVGDITNHGTLVFDRSDDTTFAGVVSGTGGLVHGGHILRLSAPQTYTGPTSVRTGAYLVLSPSDDHGLSASTTVDLAAGSGLDMSNRALTLAGLSGAGAVYSYGGSAGHLTLNIAADRTETFAGLLGGGSPHFALTKTGPGTQILSGANTYTGGTTVSAGTLAGNTSSLQGHITNHAAVVFDQASDGTYAGNMSGAGSLTKTGAGTLTLTGANTYVGGTTIAAGTLVIDDRYYFNPFTGDIANNGTLVLGRLGSETFHGVVSGTGGVTYANRVVLEKAQTYTGPTTVAEILIISPSLTTSGLSSSTTVHLEAGSLLNFSNGTLAVGGLTGSGTITTEGLGAAPRLTLDIAAGQTKAFAGVLGGSWTDFAFRKTGPGTQILSGTSNYTRGTTVAAGTLQGNSASLQGDIANHAAVVFDQASAGTYAGAMSGSGSLTKIGAGNLTLSGANTYTGGTTVSAGILTGTTTSLQGDIANAAALVFDQASSGAYAGVISGAGSVTKTGAGNVTLSGANTYTGGTTVSAGILTGTTTSLQGDIANAAALVFDQASSGAYAGIISGAGSVAKTGAGNLTLTGANTYSGGTTVSAGTLTGTTTSLQGDIANDATLVFDQASSGTYAGVITGAGSVTKTGAGALTLTGANTHSGGTTIHAGAVSVGGAAPLGSGGITVNGGALVGTGNLGLDQAVAIDGSDAALTIVGYLEFGSAGIGSLTVVNGGQVASGTSTAFGVLGSAAGIGSVTGSGSRLDVGGVLYLGYLGTGTLSVGSGGVITAGSVSFSGGGGSGTLVVNAGGAFETGDIHTGDGFSHLNLSGGTLKVTGDSFATTITTSLGASTDSSLDTNGHHATHAGAISGTGALTKTGAGNLTLSGANTYTGGTTVSAGILIGTTASLPGDIVNHATLVFDQAASGTHAGAISGPGALVKAGDGNLFLAGVNTYAGGTTVSAGILTGTTASLQGDIANNAVLVFAQSGAGTYGGAVSGTGALVKTGAGTLTLAGANTYAGGTTVNAGILAIDSDARLGAPSSPLAVTSGATLSTGGDFRTNRTITLDGSGTHLSNNGELIIGNGGTGSLALTNNATATTYNLTLAFGGGTGTVEIASGATLSVGNITELGSASSSLTIHSGGTLATAGLSGFGTVNLAGGTLRSTGAFSSALAATLSNASTVDTAGHAITLAGVLSGAGSLVKTGAGSLTLSAANTFTGDTTVSQGVLAITHANALQNSTVHVDGGSLLHHGVDAVTLGGLAGSGSIFLPATSLTIGGNGADTTFSGSLNGFGLLIKAGSGNFTYSPQFSNPNAVRLDAGSFTLGHGSALELSEVNLNGGALGFGDGVTSATLGGLAGSGDLALANTTAAPVVLTVGASGNSTTYAGVLSGAGSLVKTGAGSLTLSAANTFTGDTTVSQGALVIAHANALQNSTVHVAGGSLFHHGVDALTLGGLAGSGSIFLPATSLTIGGNGADTTFSGSLNGFGLLIKAGAGALTLTGANNYLGATHVSEGALRIGSASAVPPASAVTVASGAALDLADHSVTISSLDTAPGSAVALGSGTLTTGDADNRALSGVISGSGSLVKTGSGALTLGGANTYTGGTTVSAGTLRIGAGGASGSVVGDIANHGTVVFDRSDDHTYAGVIGGSGGLVHDGFVLRLSAAQTYSGPTSVRSGAYLVLPGSVDQGLAASTAVDLEAGAFFDFSDRALTLSGLTGAGTVYSFGGGAGHLTVDLAAGQNQTFSGALGQGAPHFAFTKAGDGTLALAGANTHTGPTTIAAGTLALGADATLAASSGIHLGTTSSPGTLDLTAKFAGFAFGPAQSLTGAGTVNLAPGRAITLAGGLAPGNSPGLVTVNGDLVLTGTSTTFMELGGLVRGTGYDAIDVTGALGFGGVLTVTLVDDFAPALGDSFRLFTFSSFGGGFAQVNLPAIAPGLVWNTARLLDEGTLEVGAIPEPSAFAALAGVAAVAFAATRRRRR